ncbi:MAG: hypothetical protein BM556_04950 [Bacteriovorax sp. MedPE-SWde]|nr:MAG: hypothetical protein BM556_04950 [Bacteriovorax sp. MedPE-SWde]
MIQRIAELTSYTRGTTSAINRIRKTSINLLTNEEELLEFQGLAYKNIGVRFPLDFLQAARVFAVRNQRGVICGGFALAKGEHSRVIKSLPTEAMNTLKSQYPNYREDIFEITALWLCRSERSKTLSVRFWTKLYREVVRKKRPYFIYAFSSEKKKLGKIYQVVKPTRIFEGYTNILPGMNEPDHEIVEVGSVRAAHMAWVTQFSFLYRRLLHGRSAKKRVVYQ